MAAPSCASYPGVSPGTVVVYAGPGCVEVSVVVCDVVCDDVVRVVVRVLVGAVVCVDVVCLVV